jgi:hypothetical protein
MLGVNNSIPSEGNGDPNSDIKGEISGVLGQISALLGNTGEDAATKAEFMALVAEVLRGDQKTPGIQPQIQKLEGRVNTNKMAVDGRMSEFSGRIGRLEQLVAALQALPRGGCECGGNNSATSESDNRNISDSRDNKNDGRTRGGR